MLVSIELTSNSINIVEGGVSKGEIAVNKLCSAPLPAGCVSYGQLREPEMLARLLKQTLIENDIRSKKAVITINSPETVLKSISVPDTSMSSVERIIKSGLLPVTSRQNYVSDFFVLSAPGIVPADAIAVAVPETLCVQYRALLTDCGLKPYAMDVAANALYKAVKDDAALFGSYAAVFIAHIDFDCVCTLMVERDGWMCCDIQPTPFDAANPDAQALLETAARSINAAAAVQAARNNRRRAQYVHICSDVCCEYDIADALNSMVEYEVKKLTALSLTETARGAQTARFATALSALIRR